MEAARYESGTHVNIEYPFLVTIINQTLHPKGSMVITHLPQATKHSRHAAFQILAVTDPCFTKIWMLWSLRLNGT